MFKRSLLGLTMGAIGLLWAQSAPVSALPATSAVSSLKAVAASDGVVVKATFGGHHKAHKPRVKKTRWWHRDKPRHVKKKRHVRVKTWHRAEPRAKKVRWWHWRRHGKGHK